MAKKRKAYLHVGMPGVGDVVETALVHHRDALVELGVDVPAKSSQESFRAAVEIMRDHKEWGLKRSEVEGQWTRLCRRVEKGKNAVLFSQPLLAGADKDQIALLLDALHGFEIHVVVTATAPHGWAAPGDPQTDLGVVLERWGAAVRAPDRLHVVVVDAHAKPAKAQKAAWKALGKVVGFGTASLGLDDVQQPVTSRPLAIAGRVAPERVGVLATMGETWVETVEQRGFTVHGNLDALRAVPVAPVVNEETRVSDLAQLDRALQDAFREIERLTRRNEGLEQRLAEVDKKRKKLKRRLSAVA